MKDIKALIESEHSANELQERFTLNEAEKSVEDLVAKKLNDELGRLVNTAKIGTLTFTDKTSHVELFKKSLKPSEAGLLAPIFKTIDVKGDLYYGLDSAGAQIVKAVIDFKYKHSGGGSNGYEVTYTTYDGGKTWNIYG